MSSTVRIENRNGSGSIRTFERMSALALYVTRFTRGPALPERHQHREEGEGAVSACASVSDAQPTPGGGDTKTRQQKAMRKMQYSIYF
jgi:hypothetical protein